MDSNIKHQLRRFVQAAIDDSRAGKIPRAGEIAKRTYFRGDGFDEAAEISAYLIDQIENESTSHSGTQTGA